MREIKYRVWDKERKTYEEPILDGYVLTQGGVLFGSSVLDDWMTEINEDSVVLEQYTGLKDAEDVEIYEGDIIRIDNGGIEKVEFGRQAEEEDFGAFYTYLGYNFFLGWSYESPEDLYKIEVIGNVHQNPELLEGRK